MISRKDLTPYSGKDLTGFNGSSTRPLGHLELMVTYGNPDGEQAMFRTVKTAFLVLPCKSVYQCIIGRPTLGKLGAVTSTVQLKMKFYNLEDKVVTIPVDIGAARRCFFMKEKLDRKFVGSSELSNNEGHKKQPKVEDEVNMINLNARDPEKGEGNQAKKMKKEKEVPSLEAGDTLDHLAEAFAQAVTLRPGSPKKEGNEFMKDKKVTREHPAVNLGNKRMIRRRWSQKDRKTRAAFRTEECFMKMKGGRRLSEDSNHRNHELEKKDHAKNVQRNATQKDNPSVLKRKLLRLAKKRKLSQKGGTSAKKDVRRLADMKGMPWGQ